MTELEKEILQMSVDLWNRIQDLPIIHKSDNLEISKSIHDIQARIMSRGVRMQMNEANKKWIRIPDGGVVDDVLVSNSVIEILGYEDGWIYALVSPPNPNKSI